VKTRKKNIVRYFFGNPVSGIRACKIEKNIFPNQHFLPASVIFADDEFLQFVVRSVIYMEGEVAYPYRCETQPASIHDCSKYCSDSLTSVMVARF
jgi:hypothetical protein